MKELMSFQLSFTRLSIDQRQKYQAPSENRTHLQWAANLVYKHCVITSKAISVISMGNFLVGKENV